MPDHMDFRKREGVVFLGVKACGPAGDAVAPDCSFVYGSLENRPLFTTIEQRDRPDPRRMP
jgi:hypothetical protein